MPYRPLSKRCPRCGNTYKSNDSLCPVCAPKERPIKARQSASARGYGHNWRKTRAEVLRKAGIPKEQWHLYDVDHNPPYDPSIEPNHSAYTLIPRLKSNHSHKTATEDTPRDYRGRFTNKGGGVELLHNTDIDRGVQVSSDNVKTQARGFA